MVLISYNLVTYEKKRVKKKYRSILHNVTRSMKQFVTVEHNGASDPNQTKTSFLVICFLLLDLEDMTFFLKWRETCRLHNEFSITSIYITIMRHPVLDVSYLAINNL